MIDMFNDGIEKACCGELACHQASERRLLAGRDTFNYQVTHAQSCFSMEEEIADEEDTGSSARPVAKIAGPRGPRKPRSPLARSVDSFTAVRIGRMSAQSSESSGLSMVLSASPNKLAH
jgi:hypothetical protein